MKWGYFIVLMALMVAIVGCGETQDNTPDVVPDTPVVVDDATSGQEAIETAEQDITDLEEELDELSLDDLDLSELDSLEDDLDLDI
ncbi:hypothetical protein HN419_05745 [Candidatus Woesearchaeota archaeon]|jgi:hypothetical protein|nr:hypothetical protein [Candidatus Woesearchaeota archaeon]MBT3537627.1 hypothetical protein [Candidatus Woesearchaeota archaeon]MBT4698439.1 hypothetical protein [Candidatus Woesearchaeota archaeon]MBT4716652.1 hypothetical protein [Candidatus Woesearchaeota archaeon]MBT7105296.1 hypothetical protein [Candidatus Woesearchaeota archaeon]